MSQKKTLFDKLYYPMMFFCFLAPCAFIGFTFYAFSHSWEVAIKSALIAASLTGGYFRLEEIDRPRFVVVIILVFAILYF